jgi:DNA (cytosine-5)-methyltransferase 1
MKILNLYAGIGGNRKLWGDDHEITAVEYDADIARVYGDLYPGDKIVVDDAHEYLLNHFKEFDFIWSSPPCQSHSRIRQVIGVAHRNYPAVFADMKLYQEIIFLQHNFKGQWIVENVRPYYEPLIKPTTQLHRHLIWSNLDIPQTEFRKYNMRNMGISQLSEVAGVDLTAYKLSDKRQVLRNCVLPELGKHVFDQVKP